MKRRLDLWLPLFAWSVLTGVAVLTAAVMPAHAQGGSGSTGALKADVLTARAIAPKEPVPRGGTAIVDVQLTIKPPYHVNANPATEDYLVATTVKVNPAAGIKAGKIAYPKGEEKKFAFSDKPLAVYEHTVTVRVPLQIAKDARPGTLPLSGTVEYQACDDNNCLLPNSTQFKTVIPIGTAVATGSAATSGAAITSTVETETSEAPRTSAAPAGDFAAATALREKYGVSGLPAIVFLDANGQERTDLRAGEELTLDSMVQRLEALKSGERFEAEEEGAAGWMGRLQSAPLWLQLALVFLGGLLLNLTPCVYPMIPITVGYFGAQSESRFGKTLTLALVYVLGLALVYSLLGVSAALTGRLFGSALQSPLATGFVALVLFLLALSMFGLFTIQPPQFLMARSGAKKGVLGALAMGALLGVVAAPCVGPVVVALLTYVGSKGDPALGFALFFILSLGLGLPYLILGAFSGAIKAMPRSGMWLERLKKVFAVPLLIAAVYYAYLAVNPLLASASTASAGTTAQQAQGHWSHATNQALTAARESGRPVVLDFRADWCIPCLNMERKIFSRPEVERAGEGVELLQVDLTRASS